jgi:3-oxoacyl-[acyl-carrier-protein] synthase II
MNAAAANPHPQITGVGLVTPLGRNTAETWQNLLAGHYVCDHSRAAGGWNDQNQHSRAIGMALQAAREAITQARWNLNVDPTNTAIVVGTSKGSIETWLTGGLLDSTGLGDVAQTLAHEVNLPESPRLTISAACASGVVALIRAAMLIESAQARRALVVATEASLHPLFIASFARLGVLPKQGAGCRPFDQHRAGFVMTEAAAAICLEHDGVADWAAGNSPRIMIDRYALGADATHLTAADPDGTTLRRLLRQVIDNRPVALIHAHGTATQANDPIELAAIQSVIAPSSQAPCLYSHKAALGHSLGAAGLVAIVVNFLAHRHHTLPGNIRTTHPLPTTHLTLSPTPITRPIRRSIALAAGFGGATAAISLISA